jgi:hypothetical protein
MIALLMLHGFPQPAAVTATLICRLATLWFAVAIGALVTKAVSSGLAELRHNVANRNQLHWWKVRVIKRGCRAVGGGVCAPCHSSTDYCYTDSHWFSFCDKSLERSIGAFHLLR